MTDNFLKHPQPRRSALFMPASNAKAIAKARSLPADVIILDLEDSVAPEHKAEARLAALAAVTEGGFGKRDVVIRANALDTPWGHDDLAAIKGSAANAVLMPKVSSAADINAFQAALTSAAPSMQLWAMIETCASMFNIYDIAACARDTRLTTFVLGTNDLAKEMHAQLTPCRTPFLPFLSATVAAARAHGLTILDSVCNEFHDLDRFRAECEQGLMFGFDGKSLIHPNQVEPCNAIYSPSPDQLEWARKIVEAFSLPENANKGVIRLDGKMVELLHRDEALRLLAMAELIESA